MPEVVKTKKPSAMRELIVNGKLIERPLSLLQKSIRVDIRSGYLIVVGDGADARIFEGEGCELPLGVLAGELHKLEQEGRAAVLEALALPPDPDRIAGLDEPIDAAIARAEAELSRLKTAKAGAAGGR